MAKRPQLVRRTVAAAVVGGETLLGREVRDFCRQNGFPAALALIADSEARAGALTALEDEPAVIGRLDAANLTSYQIAFLTGSADSARAAAAFEVDSRLIDLTGANEENPRARLRAPSVEPSGFAVAPGAIHVIAHPAAIAMTLVLNRLHLRHRILRAVAHVFEPASAHGRDGLDELQQQTVNLLSFKNLPKAVFDTQVAFNLLARYGEDAPASLESAESRVERHLATLLGQSSGAPLPSLRMLQAPIFHGNAVSLWIEFAESPGVAAIEAALGCAAIDVRKASHEPPDIAGIAGQEGIAVGAIAADRQNPAAAWLWLVADNLRLAAENALAVARELL